MRRIETEDPCKWCREHFAAQQDGVWVCTSCSQEWDGIPEDKWGGPGKPEKSESKPGEWWDTT